MAQWVWLHRTAPNHFPPHWALELYQRCRQYNILPTAGGAYEQDEELMSMMEQAGGVAALFDLDGAKLAASLARMELHTSLMLRAERVIDYINEQEQLDEQPQS